MTRPALLLCAALAGCNTATADWPEKGIARPVGQATPVTEFKTDPRPTGDENPGRSYCASECRGAAEFRELHRAFSLPTCECIYRAEAIGGAR